MRHRHPGHPSTRALAVTALLLMPACGPPDTPGRHRVIAAALKPFGILEIPTGSRLNLSNDGLGFLKKVEAAGLVTVHEVPQDFWGGFATRTFMEGAKPYKVVETPKLAEVSINPNLGGEGGGPSDDRYTWRVQVSEPTLGEVLHDEEYKGPLATPGERFRLVLATIQNNPGTARPGVPRELSQFLPSRLRAVVKYSDFKKEWSVAALDVGSAEPERWYTSNVH